MQELNSLTNFEAGGDTGQKGTSWVESESFLFQQSLRFPLWNQVVTCGCSVNVLNDHCLSTQTRPIKNLGKGLTLSLNLIAMFTVVYPK